MTSDHSARVLPQPAGGDEMLDDSMQRDSLTSMPVGNAAIPTDAVNDYMSTLEATNQTNYEDDFEAESLQQSEASASGANRKLQMSCERKY